MNPIHQILLPHPFLFGEERKVVPWERFWCPFGSEIALEGAGSFLPHQSGRGFLIDPDQGFNTRCQSTRSFANHHGALVLCGVPGAGKSAEARKLADHIASTEPESAILTLSHEEIGDAAGLRLVDEPLWKSALAEQRELVVIVDGFDQVRLESGVPVAVLARGLRGHDLTKVRLVITCRASDWSPSSGAQLLALWGMTNADCVFELCPLRRCDVLLAAATIGIEDPDGFVAELRQRNLEAHAHWPLTLNALLRAFKAGRALPASSREIFDQTIELLLRSKDGSGFASPQLRRLAERVSALLILCGRQGIVTEAPEGRGTWLHWEEVRGDSGTSIEVLPETGESFDVGARGFRELRQTALFVPVQSLSAESNQTPFGLTHHSMGEFLAAAYLRNLSVRQLVQTLFVTTNSAIHVPPPLVDTAVWLAAYREDWFECLLENTPEILLRIDATQVTEAQKERLATRLLARAGNETAGAFGEIRGLTPAFKFQGLAGILRSIVQDADAHPMSRRLALGFAGNCQVAELDEDLWQLLFDPGACELRKSIGNALADILNSREISPQWVKRLMKLAEGRIIEDDDDELKGQALMCLVPRYKTPHEIAEFLTPRKDCSLVGSYAVFIAFRLPDLIGVNDLPAYLRGATAGRWGTDDDAYNQKLLRSIVSLSINELSNPQIRNSFVQLVLSRSTTYGRRLFPRDVEAIDESERLELLRIVVNDGDWEADNAMPVVGVLHCRPRLGWLLSCLRSSPPHRTAIWAKIIGYKVGNREEREICLSELLECYEGFPELRAVLPNLRDGLTIHETLNVNLQEAEVRLAAEMPEAERNPVGSPQRRGLLNLAMARWMAGSCNAWHEVSHVLLLSENAEFMPGIAFSIPASEAWLSLDAEEQANIKRLARSFLIESDDPSRKKQEWNRTRGSESGYLAMDLLNIEIESDTELSSAVGGKWIRAFLREGWNVDDRKKSQASMLYRLNPKMVLHVLGEQLSCENNADLNCQCVDPFETCWDDEISKLVANHLRRESIRPQTCRTAFCKLAEMDSEIARDVASEWIDAFNPHGDDATAPVGRAKLFCAALLTGGKLWDHAYHFLQSPEFAKTVFLENAWCLHDWEGFKLDRFDPKILIEIYVMIAPIFVEERVRQREFAFRNWTAEDSIQRFLQRLEAEVARRSSPSEIARIKSRLPENRRMTLAFVFAGTQTRNAWEGWLPWTPIHLLRMVRSRHSCFIRSQDDLMDFVIERLVEYVSDWEGNVRPLWNEPLTRTARRTAKHEEVLSNRLVDWLKAGASTLIVNRETQKIEVMPDRVDLRIEVAIKGSVYELIVEVKKAENNGVRDSLQTQLVDRYLLRGNCSHGIYLIAWFGDKTSRLGGITPEADSENIRQMAATLKGASSLRVETLVLDCRFRK